MLTYEAEKHPMERLRDDVRHIYGKVTDINAAVAVSVVLCHHLVLLRPVATCNTFFNIGSSSSSSSSSIATAAAMVLIDTLMTC